MAEIKPAPGTEDDPNFLSSVSDGDVVFGFGGDDTLEAHTNNTTLDGGDGVDSLFSYGDGNTLLGGSGDDTLISLDPADNTVMDGGPGVDLLGGGSGTNTASYASAPAGVNVNLAAFMAFDDGNGSMDVLFGIQNVTGSAYADTLVGDGGANVLEGGGGNDTLTGNGGNDTFKFSFSFEEKEGEAKTFKFTDWLTEKYGKDFGDELPDFERGHHNHQGKHHHHNHHHHNHHHHNHHHHKHGGCDDHPEQWGLSQSFFAKNYGEWLQEVVVADLLAQDFDLDVNGNGRIGVRLNQNDPDGTPRIEGLSGEELAAIFSDRDEVTLRHGHHGHDRWYSNTYTSSTTEAETVVESDDGFDTIVDFVFGEDKLEFSGLGNDFTLEQFQTFFKVAEVEVGGNALASDMELSLVDDSWSVTLLDVGTKTLDEFYDAGVFS